MIQSFKDVSIITDTNTEEVMEQPVVVVNYPNGEGLSLVGYDGSEVYMSYRMVKEVCKAMQNHSKQLANKSK